MAAMSAAPGRFDALLTGLAQQHGGVESLLDSFFEFLHRKTDFYVVARDPAARGMGFLPGQAQEKVMRAFLKFPFKYLDEQEGGEGGGGARTRTSAPAVAAGNTNAGAARDGATASRSTDVSTVSTRASQPPSGDAGGSAQTTATAEAHPASGSVQVTEEGRQVPVGNGGATDAYSWTQTLGDLSIQVELPHGTKAKELDCKITATRIHVALKPKGAAEGRVLLDGELPEKIHADESIWSIESQKTLLISLEKARETWWASVIRGDPEIDTTKVDSTRRIDEYDEGTQGAIRKIVYEQRQRQLNESNAGGSGGALTAEEQLFERAKQLPGSPFK